MLVTVEVGWWVKEIHQILFYTVWNFPLKKKTQLSMVIKKNKASIICEAKSGWELQVEAKIFTHETIKT